MRPKRHTRHQQYISHLFVPFALDFAQPLLELVEEFSRRHAHLLDGFLANGIHTLTLDARRLGHHAVRKASSLQQVTRRSPSSPSDKSSSWA